MYAKVPELVEQALMWHRLKCFQGRNWLVLIGKHRALLGGGGGAGACSNGHFEKFWNKITAYLCR